MDIDALARLAETLADLSGRQMKITPTEYASLRERVFQYVGEDSDLETLFRPNPPRAAYSDSVIDGPVILGVVATYLRNLVVAGGPRTGRLTAATDLMEQAQRLVEEPGVTPIAPIVVGGAALEEVLRDLVELVAAEVPGKPGLNTYAQALRTSGVLTADDVKDVVALAATRNDAAHGRSERLSIERALVFLDSVNLFLRHLRERGIDKRASHNG